MPRVTSEMLKLGFEVSQTTVAKYLPKNRKPPSQTWKNFLANHSGDIVACDFFTVRSVTFGLFYVFVLISHDRRKILHLNVTTSPSAQWAGQQVVQAFPYDSAPKFLIRDRDSIYGKRFQSRVKISGIREVVTSVRAPKMNSICERVIGSIRRECLDHMIVLNERHLLRILKSYAAYYNQHRCHLSLGRDSPIGREVDPPDNGEVVSEPILGGLHHRYFRRKSAWLLLIVFRRFSSG